MSLTEFEESKNCKAAAGQLRGPFVVAVLGATVVGAALRVVLAVRLPLWLDEGFQWRFAQQSVSQLLRGGLDNPLSLLLTKATVYMLGQNLLAFRLHSLLFGILAIPAAAWLARRLASPLAGVLCAWWTAVDPLLVWNDSLARMYGLWGFLLLLIACWVTRICGQFRSAGKAGTRDWLFLGILLALALMDPPSELNRLGCGGPRGAGQRGPGGAARRILVQNISCSQGPGVGLRNCGRALGSTPLLYAPRSETHAERDDLPQRGPRPKSHEHRAADCVQGIRLDGRVSAAAGAGPGGLDRALPQGSQAGPLFAHRRALAILADQKLVATHFAAGRYLYPLFIPVYLGISVLAVAISRRLGQVTGWLRGLPAALLFFAMALRIVQLSQFLREQDRPDNLRYEGTRLLQYVGRSSAPEDVLVTIPPHIENIASFYRLPPQRLDGRMGRGPKAGQQRLSTGRCPGRIRPQRLDRDRIELPRRLLAAHNRKTNQRRPVPRVGHPISPQTVESLAAMNVIRIRDGKVCAAKSSEVLIQRPPPSLKLVLSP